MLGQSGSLSLSAINLETGLSEPHHQICHVTHSYGQLTISQWAYRGEFNNASARRALVDWYLSLFIMCKAGHQYNERPKALALMNLPLVSLHAN